MIKAVIFDMDGLLVNSELLVIQSDIDAGKRFGYPITAEMALQALGTTRQFTSELFASVCGEFDSEKFFALFDELLAEYAEKSTDWVKKGAAELLAYLKGEGIPCAVASSSHRARVERSLRHGDLLPYFDVIVTGDQVSHSKPDPEIFLKAASLMGVAPEECLVLEDSPNGIKAGRAGGMIVGMVPDLKPYCEEYAPYCDYVLEDLAKFIPVVAQSRA